MKTTAAALAAACVVMGTLAGSAQAKGKFVSYNASITSDWDLTVTVTERALGKTPVTFNLYAIGEEDFFCPDGSFAGSTIWGARPGSQDGWSDPVTVTPTRGEASAALTFRRAHTESSLTPCGDGSTPQIGYVRYTEILVTDSFGHTLAIPDQTQGTPA